MLRNSWVFKYRGEQLLEAAKFKKALHEDKEKHWSIQLQELVDKIQMSGLKQLLVEDLAFFYKDYEYQEKISGKLKEMILECQAHIFEHRNKKLEYDGWIQKLHKTQELTYSLDEEDWLYFFGV